MTKKALTSAKSKKNGSFRFGSNVFTINTGSHKAVQITLSEVAINNRVLRVHLDKPVEKVSEEGTKPVVKNSNIKATRVSARLTPTRKPSARIAERTPKSTATSSKPEISKNTKLEPKSKMIKSKTETSNKPASVSSSVTPTKVMKYKAMNKTSNNAAKYVITKSPSVLLDSKMGCPTNFAMKVKNTYQAKKRGSLEVRYLLEPPTEKPYQERTLNYKFSKLAVDVRSLRLPAPHWKIKIYMRNKAISSIAFTNKQESERILKFSSLSDNYEMIIDNKKANLLGSPLTIDTRQDVEILLDILHNIALDNPMIVYK